MSFNIITGKELAEAPRPLMLCRIVALDGDTVYLSSAATTGATSLTYGGNAYVCKVQDQAIDAIVAMSAQGYDIPGTFQLTLADGDADLYVNHAIAHGWKGATLTVTLLLWDALAGAFSTDAYMWDFTVEYAEAQANGVLRVPCVSRNSMARLKVPNVPRQRRCPWVFPSTAEQRLEGLIDPTSPHYQCGYSPDLSVGVGNLNSGSPFTTCAFTREDCVARGMHNLDSSARPTRRFGGDTWIAPEDFRGRKYTDGAKVTGFNTPNPPGNSWWPKVYGKQWVDGVNLAPAQEPNSIRSECVVCEAFHGPANVMKVVVNGHEVPQNNRDQLFTWRYVTQGGRQGAICSDAIFDSQGDPHGSTCKIEWVVPTELAGGSNPSVRVLVDGPPVLMGYAIDSASASGGEITLTLTSANPAFGYGATVNVVGNSLAADGVYQVSAATSGYPGTITLAGTSATGSGVGGAVFAYPAKMYSGYNPVWHLMDLLTLGAWTLGDFDVASWVGSAAYCSETITYADLHGDSATHERFRSSFALETASRQTLAQAVTALRQCAGIILSRNPSTGKLTCNIKRTLAEQQPAAVDGSNYSTAVSSHLADGTPANGYLAYLFDGGSIEKDSLRLTQRSISDSPNRISIQFQDEDNEYQTDSVSVVEPDAFEASGLQEVANTLQILGVPNFDQASRRANVEHAETHYGNPRDDAGGTIQIEFTTSMKAAHLAGSVGAICGLTYEQLGLS